MSTAVLDRPLPPTIDAPPDETLVPIQAPERRLRLSEALRDGARQHPQGYGALYDRTKGTTCALGALLVGYVGSEWMETDPYMLERCSLRDLIWEHAGVDMNRWVQGPAGYGALSGWGSLGAIIMRLNDIHGWGREKIADWLESIHL